MNRHRVFPFACAVAVLASCAVAPVRAESVHGGLTLTDALAAYGLTDYTAYGRTILFRGRYATLSFENCSRKTMFNGVTVYLNDGISSWGRDWVIRPADAADTIGALLRPDATLKAVPLGTVFLDPGHGGADPGTRTARRLEEKRLTLDIAKRVRLKLRACGVDAVLSRERDTTLALDERCERMVRARAALMLSIHLNASRNTSISGVETFIVPSAGYPSTDSPVDMRRSRPVSCPGNRHDSANSILAYCVQRGLLTQTRADDRGIRRARFFVIRNATCPAALVECGFMSNAREAACLSDESYRDKVAEGLARGILTYLVRARDARLPPGRLE